MDDLGVVRPVDGGWELRYERRYAHPVERVWSAITDPSRLARWYGEVAGDLRVGGEYRARLFATGWEGTGRIEACEPPHRLLVSAKEPDAADAGLIEVTLAAGGGGTTLVWEERGMPLEFIAGYGAGIQIHVEDLGAYLAGRERVDAEARFGELHPAYKAVWANTTS